MFQDLAKELMDKAGDRDIYGIEVAPDLKVSYVGLDVLSFYRGHGMPFADIGDVIDNENVIDRHYAESHIWEDGNIPNEWIFWLRMIAKARRSAGLSDPLLVTEAILKLAEQSTKFQVLLVQAGFGCFTDSGDFEWKVDFANTESVFALIDAFFGVSRRLLLFNQLKAFMRKDSQSRSAIEYSSLVAYLKFCLQVDTDLPLHVLDAGVGDGMQASKLAEISGMHLVGIDFRVEPYNSEEFYTYREEDLNSVVPVPWAVADARQMPFSSGQFDIVLLIGVVGHLDVVAITGILVEAHRVMHEGAYLMVGPQDFRPQPFYYDEFIARMNSIRSFQKVGGDLVEVDPLKPRRR